MKKIYQFHMRRGGNNKEEEEDGKSTTTAISTNVPIFIYICLKDKLNQNASSILYLHLHCAQLLLLFFSVFTGSLFRRKRIPPFSGIHSFGIGRRRHCLCSLISGNLCMLQSLPEWWFKWWRLLRQAALHFICISSSRKGMVSLWIPSSMTVIQMLVMRTSEHKIPERWGE